MHSYSSCIYRSRDPLKNFKIRVTLWRSTGSSILDDQDDDPSQHANDGKKFKELSRLYKNMIDETNKGRETVEIGWQTKIFSRNEYLKYTASDFKPKNILEEHYRDECLRLKEKNFQPGRIYTFIDEDSYNFYDDEINSSNDASTIPKYLQQVPNVSLLRRRRPLVGKSKTTDYRVPKSNIVNYKPDLKESTLFNNWKITPFHTMYIMADLSRQNTTLNTRDQCVLACIKIDPNGAIITRPDFNTFSNVYLAQTGGFSKETYDYVLEHVSGKISQEDLFREMKLHSKLYLRHADYLRNLVGHEFERLALGVLKVHIQGEILTAKNFDYDDLHVYYQLELPRNWYIDPAEPSSGFTHTSRAKVEGSDDVVYFSHPFEFNLYYKNDEINPLYWDHLPNLPKLLFEVASYDSWCRYRVEGYGWMQIPTKSGMHKETMLCWRPRGDTFVHEMRRFFIGGSPELEDITYVAVPSTHEGSILSRFGFRTVTTGELTVRMNIALQSQIFLDKMYRRKNQARLLVDKFGNLANVNDIIAILEAFNLARKSMIEARENSNKLIEE